MLRRMGETIVVGYDGQDHSERALELAIETVQATGGKVIVVVAEDVPPIPLESSMAFGGYDPMGYEVTQPTPLPSTQEPLPGAQEIIDRAMKKVEAAGVTGEYTWGVGNPAQVIVDAARERGASKIVIGSHHHGFFARLFENVEAEVRRAADCEVVVAE